MIPPLRPAALLLALAALLPGADLPLDALAVWEAGAGALAGAPVHAGVAVLGGQMVESGADAPVRLVLPGTTGGLLTLAAGSRVVLQERAADTGAERSAELVVTVERGAAGIAGDLRPRFAGVRLRGAAAEALAAGGTLLLERDEGADTAVLVDGDGVVSPLPQVANGWQATAERVRLAPRQGVVVDHLAGVGEPFPVPVRPQLAGAVADRLTLRRQAEQERTGDLAAQQTYRDRFGGGPESWQLDAAGLQLGPASDAWWARTAAAAPADPPSPLSGFVQLAALNDTNAAARAGGGSDQALSLLADARWRFWQRDGYAARLQAVGGLVTHRAEREGDIAQMGGAAAFLREGGPLLWSLSAGGAYLDERDLATAMGRLGGDIGWEWSSAHTTLLGVGWSRLGKRPDVGDRYLASVATLRPAHQATWDLGAVKPVVEASLLLTDSRSDAASDDYLALRPGLSALARVGGRLDVGLGLAWERTAYREASDGDGDLRERTWAASLSADWWLARSWSAGAFLNGTRLDSSLAGQDYSRVQAGLRSTYYW